MNPMMEAFEKWFISTDLTERQLEVMLDFKDGHYTYMQTHLAYEAFSAGYKEGKQ